MIAAPIPLTSRGRTAPSLDLDFTRGTLDSRITFTRSGSASRVNSSGLVEAVSADVARFDYDSVTLACRGLLIEETRTNVIYPSVDMTAATWGLYLGGGATGTRTANAGTAPDGTNTATQIDMTAGSGEQVMLNSGFALSTGLQYAASFYVKATNAGDVGKVIGVRHAGTASYTFVTLTANWRRASNVETSAFTGTTTLDIGLRPDVGTSGGSVSFLIWGVQLEQGAFPTSYIPTTTTALARNADVAIITGTAFSGFWRSGPGSILVRALPSTVSGTRPLVQVDDATADNIIALRGNTTNPELYIREGGADKATIDAGTISATAYRLAGSWKAGNGVATLNGFAPVKGTPASIPAATQMRLGSDGTNYLNGHLQSLEYWDEFLTPATLQSVTTSAGYRSIIGPVMRDAIIA